MADFSFAKHEGTLGEYQRFFDILRIDGWSQVRSGDANNAAKKHIK
jgi:hypothetical protein